MAAILKMAAHIFLCKKWTQGHHITLEIKFGWNPTTFKIVRFYRHFELATILKIDGHFEFFWKLRVPLLVLLL